MATQTPSWLTRDFLQSCLENEEEQPITVTSYTVKPAVVPEGSNYGSQLLRVHVDYIKEDTKHSVYLIMKVPLSHIEEFFIGLYEKEPKFFNEFIKQTYKYSKHDVVPRHYASPNPQCVVLEDLSVSGYVMGDRHNLLDLEHCQLAIKARAKLHALSVAVYRDNPEMIESLVKEDPAFKENTNKMTKTMLQGNLLCMIAYLEDKPDYKEYFDILKKASENDNLWKMYQEVEDSCKKTPLKTLTQLDPWCTNMMFKYNSLGKVESVKLLDFQGLSFISPLKEIVSFMSMCPNMEVKKTKIDGLYQLYCDTLNKNLAELGCPERINFEAVKAEVVAMSPLTLFLILGLPFTLADGAADFNEYLSGNILNKPIRESPIYKLYQSTTFNRYFPEILDVIAKDGVFDWIKEKMKQMELK